MFKKLGLNTIKIVSEHKLREMLFVAFVGVFSSLLSIEDSYASSVKVLYTVLDETETQNKYIQEISDELGNLGCNIINFKLNESMDVINNLGNAIQAPLNKGEKRVIFGKGDTGIGVYELSDIRYFSQHQSKISGIIFLETVEANSLRWMYPGRGDIVILPKNAASPSIKSHIKSFEGYFVEYDEFSGSKIAKDLYQILTKK
ncbi:MAG: hypothetical protein ACRYGR_09045 [Janthinobacterium lividum]